MRLRIFACLPFGCCGYSPLPGVCRRPPPAPLTDAQADAQVTQLLRKMTTGEKLLQLLSYCPNGVPRLGIPNLQAGEALHGVVTGGAPVSRSPSRWGRPGTRRWSSRSAP